MIKTSQDLYNFLVEKNVTRLCHFTKTKNLVHILSSTEGIVATAFIKNDVKHQNDLGRYDGHWSMYVVLLNTPIVGIGKN